MAVMKTPLGAQVMKDRSVALTPAQRSALILCDGKRSAIEILSMTAGVGVTQADLQKMLELGLIDIDGLNSAASAPSSQTSHAQQTSSPASDENAAHMLFNTAHAAAITLCADLGFKGFGLNMALTGVDSMEKLQKLAPEIRRAAGDAKYMALHQLIFGQSL